LATDETLLPVLARKVTIPNPQGLHARPVMQFVEIAYRFQSKIKVRKGKREVDGHDPMEMMLLDAPQGSELEIEADGPDAAQVLEALAKLVAEGFGEMDEPGDAKKH
jgi:phosphocarrier protein HPr